MQIAEEEAEAEVKLDVFAVEAASWLVTEHNWMFAMLSMDHHCKSHHLL